MAEYITPTWSTPTIPGAGTLPYADLANRANQFMTNQSIMPFLQNLPGYANAVQQRSTNTAQMLAGQLPQDVISQITQQAAERGIGGGQGGSPNTNAAFLRALGLNSLQMQQEGSNQLTQSINDTPVPELWNPMSLITPQITSAQELAQTKLGQQTQSSAEKRKQAALNWNAKKSGTKYNYIGGFGGFS